MVFKFIAAPGAERIQNGDIARRPGKEGDLVKGRDVSNIIGFIRPDLRELPCQVRERIDKSVLEQVEPMAVQERWGLGSGTIVSDPLESGNLRARYAELRDLER
jgi:hypothetical protein